MKLAQGLQVFLVRYAEDLLIMAGLAIIALATFRLSVTAGLYVVGVEMLALGVLHALSAPPGGR